MSISQLVHKLKEYDAFGEHRINGFKALYLIELLFLFNFLSTLTNPYFYYFYVPLTAFAAEIAGNTLRDKYLFLFYTLLGSTLTIFLFGLFSEYKIFFIFFVFSFALFIYFIALYQIRSMFVAAPLILSLAVYSLIYKNADSNLYIALNNAVKTLVAMLIMFIGLYTFPKKYYLFIWRRALQHALDNIALLVKKIYEEELKSLPIISGIIMMERYSKMLSRRMHYFSVLKITLLTFELVMSLSYMLSFKKSLQTHYMTALHQYLLQISNACKARRPLFLSAHDVGVLHESHELKVLYRLILSWNFLCSKL